MKRAVQGVEDRLLEVYYHCFCQLRSDGGVAASGVTFFSIEWSPSYTETGGENFDTRGRGSHPDTRVKDCGLKYQPMNMPYLMLPDFFQYWSKHRECSRNINHQRV